ncbi:MAG: hypothetical protein GY861_17560 [bacterium]|nr:hypothetical protein [bacterium]
MTRTALSTVAEVIQTCRYDNVSEAGGSDIVQEAIDWADETVYEDYDNPLNRSTFVLDSTETKYEYRNDNKKVYRIDQVYIVDSNNNRIAYTEGTASEANKEFTWDSEFNTITFHADTISNYNGNRVLVNYTLQSIKILARTKAALFVIEQANTTNAEGGTPAILSRLRDRAKSMEASLAPCAAIGSTNEINYDETYGVYIPQKRFHTY